MKMKKNVKKQVRKQRYRTLKVFGVVIFTLAALVLTSIIGPDSHTGRVRADNLFSQLNFASPTGGTYTTRTLQTNPYVVDPGTVPGTISLARYVPPVVGESGYRGSIDPCISRYALDNTRNGGSVNGNHNVPCNTTLVPDSALGDQDGLSGLAALDHLWIQGEDNNALVYQLPRPSNNAIVFPAIDHSVGIYEAVEYTVWGLPAGTPQQDFTPTAPWVEGRLVKFFKDGWNPHVGGTATYCQSFLGDNHETDDYVSVWSFRDDNGVLVNVNFVAILAGLSLHITPEPPQGTTFDNSNCFFEELNASLGSGYYTSADCEIDAVGISTGVTGCIGDECLPPPPPPPTSTAFCSYTQGKFNDKAKNPVATYVQNNFSTLFPNGLTIGVNDGNGPRHHATWTNVNNLRVYIGGGGTTGVLTMDASNPTARSQTGGGVLASQVLALTLNIQLSGSGGGQPAGFGNLILCNTGNANLNGKTVQDILNQANLFLGGSPNYNLGLNASALSSLIDNLNWSWDDCVQSGFAQSFLCLPQQP